ncbi:acid-sensing ion channel 4-A-like [Eriocheir sinensis]|uniref:acid-sensing ion channel 4-A-like n=1 Tax=Eriocheir sinensis TaxID=95602 RepID=UPI0021C5FBB4|nr:acid-sensing ion channel 4-A-like [Eriocheir sinensis]
MYTPSHPTHHHHHHHHDLSCSRVLWAVVLACGLAGTIYLISSKVILYLSMPTSMRVSYDDANTLTALPAVTVCVREMYDYHNLLKLWREAGQTGRLPKDADVQLLSVSNLTLDEVWRRGGYERERLVGQCFVGPGKNCEERGVWRPVLTRYGYCHSFSGATTSVPGQQFGIYLVLRYRGHPYGIPFRGFIVAVHDPLQSPAEAIEDGATCPQKITKTGKKLGCHRLVSVTLQKVHLLHRDSRPCRQKPGYSSRVCRVTCLHEYVLRHHGCKLPYMLGKGRVCQSEEEVKRVSSAVYQLYDKGQFNHTAACDCPPACDLNIYRSSTDTTWNSQRNSIVKVFLEATQNERVVESYSYPVPALVSHIGGFMGLFLSASILTFQQLLEILLLNAYALAVWVLKGCMLSRKRRRHLKLLVLRHFEKWQ